MCPQLAEMGEREPESDGEDAEVYCKSIPVS